MSKSKENSDVMSVRGPQVDALGGAAGVAEDHCRKKRRKECPVADDAVGLSSASTGVKVPQRQRPAATSARHHYNSHNHMHNPQSQPQVETLMCEDELLLGDDDSESWVSESPSKDSLLLSDAVC